VASQQATAMVQSLVSQGPLMFQVKFPQSKTTTILEVFLLSSLQLPAHMTYRQQFVAKIRQQHKHPQLMQFSHSTQFQTETQPHPSVPTKHQLPVYLVTPIPHIYHQLT
jgi:hypothetical protein